MSWFRNAIGDIKHVVAKAEAEAKIIEQSTNSKLNKTVASFESKVLTAISEAFEMDGQKLDAEGRKLLALGVSVESRGHFSPDGQGDMTITIKSVMTPAAPEMATAKPEAQT